MWLRPPSRRDLAREFFSPPPFPVANGTVWAVSLLLLLVVLVADIATPSSFAVGTILCASVAFAALGESRKTVWQLTALAVLANLIAAFWNSSRDGTDPAHLANRAVSILTVLLVGFLSTRAREASERAAAFAEEQRQLARERTRRQLAEELGGPLGQHEFVVQAGESLQRLTGASSVEIGAVNQGALQEPYSLALAPELAESDHLRLLGQPLPPEFLALPASGAEVWRASEPNTYLARLRRPAEGDLLLLIRNPQVSAGLLTVALRTLQPLLERTALLDQLRGSRQQLASRGDLLRDLVYAFSHDLRTPLLANSMNMQAALRGAYGPLPTEFQATLSHGLEANESLLALAEQLLLVAKYESGEKTDDDLQTVRLRELVGGVADELKLKAQAHAVRFDLHLADVRVQGSKHDLRRAVQNLLDNAVKFSPAGATVTVELLEDGTDAMLRVLDHGAGVPAERQKQLFQRFRSGGPGSGRGLGLYLTRRIAEAHGGRVRYFRTGAGESVFTLTVPVRPPTKVAQEGV